VRRLNAYAIDVRHLPDEVVKGRPKVIGGIAYKQAQTRKFGNFRNRHNPIVRLYVELLIEGYGWSIELPKESIPFYLESLNVFASPSQLRVSAVEGSHKGNSRLL